MTMKNRDDHAAEAAGGDPIKTTINRNKVIVKVLRILKI